ncbi:MAG: hypothetical protein L3V56_07540 [Candidatus Magnetoovum sp. WYHC-5]|nr:hypothetical protein [Candidatus Magnetoovum sp. WYHC-5]
MYLRAKNFWCCFIVMVFLIISTFPLNAEEPNNVYGDISQNLSINSKALYSKKSAAYQDKEGQIENKHRSMSLEDLTKLVSGDLLSAEAINKYSCPDNLSEVAAARKVVQFIENTYYEWDEYEKIANNGSLEFFCIKMKAPQSKLLTQYEAQVLLSASGLWMEQANSATGGNNEENYSLPGAVILPSDSPSLKNLVPVKEYDNQLSRNVIGTDERERVASYKVMQYPWNTISFASIWASSDTEYASMRATAFLVGPYVAFTCGHVVYLSEDNDGDGACNVEGFAAQIDLSPGQYQSSEGADVIQNYGTLSSVELSANSSYTDIIDADCNDTEQYNYDLGALFLDSYFAQISTYMPIEFDYTPNYINIAGYPLSAKNDEETYSLWYSKGYTDSTDTNMLSYKADTSGGMSGSPVWVYNPYTAQRRVVAVHCMGGETSNGATRFVSDNYDLVTEWLQWVPGQEPSISHTLTPPSSTTAYKGDVIGPFYSSVVNNTNDIYYFYPCIITPVGSTMCLNQFAVYPGDSLSNDDFYLYIPYAAQSGTTNFCEYIYDNIGTLTSSECFSFEVSSSSEDEGIRFSDAWKFSREYK